MNRTHRNLLLGGITVYFAIIIGFSATNYAFIPPTSEYDLYFEESPIVPVVPITQGVINNPSHSVFYFVQLSDIHINPSEMPESLSRFDKMCATINGTIKPAFVIASGDNTDGGFIPPFFAHGQYEDEYIAYNSTMAKYGFNSSFWLPVPGNHDGYDTGFSREFWYRYMRNITQYAIDFDTGFGVYRVYMTDTTQKFGPLSPYNLYGETHSEELEHFLKLINFGDTAAINQSVVAGHFPLNHIQSARTEQGKDFRDLVVETGAQYSLVGHLHEQGLYKNYGDYMEIHCPSFKENYNYRICAFDNDMMSFSDLVQNKWPAVVVTTPLDARFYNDAMPLERMVDQSEIRALIFDEKPIKEAYVLIDGTRLGDLSDLEGDNLWSLAWDPSQYASGTHEIKVVVVSESGSVDKTFKFVLSPDKDFKPLPVEYDNEIIGWYYSAPLLIVFGLVFLLIVGIMFFRATLPPLYYQKHMQLLEGWTPQNIREKQPSWWKWWFQRRWLQSAVMPKWRRRLFFVMLAAFFILPLYIAPIAGNVIGGAWIYGIFVAGTYIITPSQFIHPLLFSVGLIGFQDYLFRTASGKIRNRTRLGAIFYFLWTSIILGAVGIMMDPMLILLSPATYLHLVMPFAMAIKIEFENRKMS